MNAIIRLMLNGMFVSVVCLTQHRTALPEDATSKYTPATKAEATEVRTHFSFQKRGKLISRPVGMPEPGPYYTCLVKMDQVDRFPYEYALYFSTDHDRGKGGIWLYMGNGDPTDADSRKSYDQAAADGEFDYLQEKPAANPIFFDSVQGRQTETPHANVIDGTVYMRDLPGQRRQSADTPGPQDPGQRATWILRCRGVGDAHDDRHRRYVAPDLRRNQKQGSREYDLGRRRDARCVGPQNA